MDLLFDLKGLKKEELENLSHNIVTPLGEVQWSAMIDGRIISLRNSKCIFEVENGYVFRWEYEGFIVEMLFIKEQIKLPKGMSVEECWSMKSRILATKEIEHVEISCKWGPNYTWTERNLESGENFDAITYCNDECIATILTQDVFCLKERATNNNWMPARLKDIFFHEESDEIFEKSVVRSIDGLSVRINDLFPNEKCQINFSMAWKNSSFREDLSTWYAADIF